MRVNYQITTVATTTLFEIINICSQIVIDYLLNLPPSMHVTLLIKFMNELNPSCKISQN